MYRVIVCNCMPNFNDIDESLYREWLRYLVPKVSQFNGPAIPKTLRVWNPSEYIHKQVLKCQSWLMSTPKKHSPT